MSSDIDHLIVSTVAANPCGDALVTKIAASVAEGQALGPEGFGSVSPIYIPAASLSRTEKIEHGRRIFVYSRLLELRNAGRIHWCVISDDTGKVIIGASAWRPNCDCRICRPENYSSE